MKGYFIYGFPNETIDDFEQTFKLAKTLRDYSEKTLGNFRTSVFQFRPYHGTKLFNLLINSYGSLKEFIHNDSLNDFNGRSQYNFYTGNYSACSDEQIEEYIRKTLNLNRNMNRAI